MNKGVVILLRLFDIKALRITLRFLIITNIKKYLFEFKNLKQNLKNKPYLYAVLLSMT
jgi:hypothetical protein